MPSVLGQHVRGWLMASASKVVDDYIARFRPKCQAELDWFGGQSTLRDAVRVAALATDEGGKRCSHQRRIRRDVLLQAHAALLDGLGEIRSSKSFEKLLSTIEFRLSLITGIGPLMIYDTSLRIGRKLGLKPTAVFLHAGTRLGAQALRLNTRRRSIPTDEFPPAFQRLETHEIEDVLCIYRDAFMGGPVSECGRPSGRSRRGQRC